MGEAAQTEMTEVEKDESDIRVNEIEENVDVEFEPLFGEEKSTEEALTGEDPGKAEEKPEEKAKEKEPEKKASTDEKPAAESKDTKEPEKEPEKLEKEPDYTKPPPKGYVAIQTMHEARANVDSAKRQLETANQTIELLQSQQKAPKEKDEFSDFEILSDNDWEELVKDDVEEALIYKNRLDKFNTHQRTKQKEKEIQLQRHQQIETAISNSVDKIATNVPGIFDEGNEIQKKLFDFGVENGFDGNYLEVMTNPATRITPIDKDGKPVDTSYPLGGGAVSLVTMIHKLNESIKGADPEKLRTEISEKLEIDLREKITQEILEKFKTETTGQSFRSISDISGGSNDELGEKKFYTEADMARMSPEEKERVLTGA
jgi:hypothetical protein